MHYNAHFSAGERSCPHCRRGPVELVEPHPNSTTRFVPFLRCTACFACWKPDPTTTRKPTAA